MNQAEQLIVLANLTLAEFKSFSKALRVLMNAGIDQFTGMEMLLIGIDKVKRDKRELKLHRPYVSK